MLVACLVSMLYFTQDQDARCCSSNNDDIEFDTVFTRLSLPSRFSEELFDYGQEMSWF